MASTRWNIAQWFERKWWQNYLKEKTPQDYLIWKKKYWTDFLQKIDFSKEKVKYPAIDIGCGPAGIFTIFQHEEVTALDPLLDKYEDDLSIFSRGKYPKVNFVANDFESHIITKKYKTIFCLNAINHFQEIVLSLQKLANIAEEDAQLILSIDAHNHSFFKHLFRLLPLDILHPHQYDLAEYTRLVEQAGFHLTSSHCMQKHFFFDYWVLVLKKNA